MHSNFLQLGSVFEWLITIDPFMGGELVQCLLDPVRRDLAKQGTEAGVRGQEDLRPRHSLVSVPGGGVHSLHSLGDGVGVREVSSLRGVLHLHRGGEARGQQEQQPLAEYLQIRSVKTEQSRSR